MTKALELGQKFIDFCKLDTEVDILEGQTYAGKTTVGFGIKFMLMVAKSNRKQHGIAGLDIGTIEKNIINKENGIRDLYGDDAPYYPNGNARDALPHIEFEGKTIYVFGYADEARWKKALGGQMGCLGIDEANIANIEFLKEAMMRADYKMLTLNPDDPNLPIYSAYINHARPLKKYANDYPQELLSQQLSESKYPRWVHWYFRMDDNVTLTQEKKDSIVRGVPVGSKQYKNKILGLRGRSEGLVYTAFDRTTKVIPLNAFSFLPNEYVYRIVVGMDSGLNEDATTLVPLCMTSAGRLICLPTMYYEPKMGSNASSQQAMLVERWLDHWLRYFELENIPLIIVGDSAALTQSVILEINLKTKYKASKVKQKDIQKDTQRAIGIIEKPDYFYIVDAGRIDPTTMQVIGNNDMFIIELENKVWDKKKGNVPEDGNDHCIDAFKYGTYLIYYSGGVE